MNMEQARFSYTFAESINESTKHVAHNVERVTQFTIILNNRLAVYAKAENVDGSKMQQPFGLFYIIRFFMTFQDLGLIPWFSRRGKFEFLIPSLSGICVHHGYVDV